MQGHRVAALNQYSHFPEVAKMADVLSSQVGFLLQCKFKHEVLIILILSLGHNDDSVILSNISDHLEYMPDMKTMHFSSTLYSEIFSLIL